MNFYSKIALSALLMSIGTATYSNDFMNRVNNGLSNVNKVLGALGGNPSSTATNNNINNKELAPITKEQVANINYLLENTYTKNGDIKTAIREASPNISKIVGFLSCYSGYYSERYLSQYTAPEHSAFGSFITPLSRAKYHPQSQCISIKKMQGWSMPAKNALRFEVIYVSESSGESIKNTYEMVKQPDGEWLATSALWL